MIFYKLIYKKLIGKKIIYIIIWNKQKGHLAAEKLQKIIDLIVEDNKIDVYSTELINAKVLAKNAKVFRVKMPFKHFNVYIVDTTEGARIASEPEIVGDEFLNLNLEASMSAARAMKNILSFERPIVFLHILRASTGYMLHKAFAASSMQFYEAFVRVKYVKESYRNHTRREIKVVYKKFENIPKGDVTLIAADTIATGSSIEVAIRTAQEELLRNDVTIEELVLYGFISKKGLEKVYKVSQDLGIKSFYAFAMQDITPLAYNGYDMPLYGPDESLWSREKKFKLLGSIVDVSTLERMLLEYAPGMDQPGDWSERQKMLFNGYGFEQGDIASHLERSLLLLEKLRKLVKKADWYGDWVEKIFEKRKQKLVSALQNTHI